MRYIYYRIWDFYSRNKDPNPKTMAEMVISIVIIVLFWGIFLMTIELSTDSIVKLPSEGIYRYSLLFLTLAVYILLRLSPFDRKVVLDHQLISRWKEEPEKLKKRNGWIIFLCILIGFGFGVLMSVYRGVQ